MGLDLQGVSNGGASTGEPFEGAGGLDESRVYIVCSSWCHRGSRVPYPSIQECVDFRLYGTLQERSWGQY